MKKSGCRKMKMKKNAKSNERPVLREFQCIAKTKSIFRFYIITMVIANNVIQLSNENFKHHDLILRTKIIFHDRFDKLLLKKWKLWKRNTSYIF